ncbi:DUF6438 domain-containing protein [Massilia norwichensis]|uniref:DUF6438 domain-containing protein n=1 Tax=Massilia norwichensis TaxID=1442366 RepID=A0ABT2A4Q2_9BURK|nr:DUF6438 domain-containing protein [Massilia norwichensis]MCS0589178.1 DUF6438 domain-containing protein [Massilia norwichensis]
MMRQALWLSALLALTLAGCRREPGAPPSQPPAPAQVAVGFDTLRLERNACYGSCPVYAVEIGRDGKGSFIGKEHVKANGTHPIRLAPADIALLSSVLTRSGFWSLKDHYVSKEDGCEALWTDQSGLSIRVVDQEKNKTVALYHGCRGPTIPAEALNWLADTIDLLANTRPLVFDPATDK